jgi:hypothetical protein
MRDIRLGDDADKTAGAQLGDLEDSASQQTAAEQEALQQRLAERDAAEQVKLLRASKIAKYTTSVMTIVFLVLWPMPLYGTGYIFNQAFFSGWVIVGIIWLMCSTVAVGVYPLWEGRTSIARNFGGMWRDITGKGRRPVYHGEVLEGENAMASGVQTPVNTGGKAWEK